MPRKMVSSLTQGHFKAVRKWLNRFVPGSLKGLEDKSRAPKNPCRKISSEERERAIQLKKELLSFEAEGL